MSARSTAGQVAATTRPPTGGLARQEAIDGYLFILPWILGLIIFTAGPFLAGLYLSFTDFNGLQWPNWIGIRNYQKMMLEDQKFGQSIYNTVYYVGLSVPLGMILGLLLAILLNQRMRLRALFRTAFYMPAIVPAVPSVALFVWILHDRFGLLNETLFSLFNIAGPHWLTSPEWVKPALILWSLWQAGGGMIIYLAGLQGVPETLYEAASIDGCGTMGRFWHVTLPMISSTLFFVLCMSIIGSFQVFTPAFILGWQSYGTMGPADALLFWVVFIYDQGFHYFNMGYASALAWVLFVVIMIVTLIQFRLAGRWVYYEA